ncbi:MAG: transposase [Candidatus Methanoculleus thermohydrogenotrophicum]|jgi:hypothetical protein|nr:transposase [Candidatus Methanoculleus thermohydrogenotrophicum]
MFLGDVPILERMVDPACIQEREEIDASITDSDLIVNRPYNLRKGPAARVTGRGGSKDPPMIASKRPGFPIILLSKRCHHERPVAAGITENYRHTWSEALPALIDEIRDARTASHSLRRAVPPDPGGRSGGGGRRWRQLLRFRGGGVNEAGRSSRDRKISLTGGRNEILTFIQDFTVPFTNNQAERELRMTKVQQKITGTFRSEEKVTDFCRVGGYATTVKKHNQLVLRSRANTFGGKTFTPTAVHRPARIVAKPLCIPPHRCINHQKTPTTPF